MVRICFVAGGAEEVCGMVKVAGWLELDYTGARWKVVCTAVIGDEKQWLLRRRERARRRKRARRVRRAGADEWVLVSGHPLVAPRASGVVVTREVAPLGRVGRAALALI